VKKALDENDSMNNSELATNSAEELPTLATEPIEGAGFDDSPAEVDEEDDEMDEAAPIPISKPKNSNPARNDATIRMLFGRLHGPIENLRYGDRASLRDHLVLLHAPLVEHCARNFAASGEPVEDLVQEGYVGLIKAVDRFDPDKGVRFSTYACHLINGEIRHYLRDLGRLIHEPGWHFELRQRIARTNDQLTQQLSRAPEPEEIATSLNIEPHTVREVLKNQNVLAVEYLDNDSDSDSDDGRGGEWLNKATGNNAPDGAVAEARVDDQMMLDIALPQLRELEKKAVTMHFFEDCSKTEVAKRLNISVNYAAYLIKRATERLRNIIETDEEVSNGSQSQQRTRAAYLMELVKSSAQPEAEASPDAAAASRPNRRRAAKVSATIPAPPRRGATSLTEFVGWADEEVRRAARYAQEFSVLWLQIRNWAEVTEKLDGEATQLATAAAQRLAYRSCRDVDKVAMVSIPEIAGLHFLVLMPHTGESGERTGHRWMQNCSVEGIPAVEQELLTGAQARYAFALFPRDGKTADDLFRVLGGQLRD